MCNLCPNVPRLLSKICLIIALFRGNCVMFLFIILLVGSFAFVFVLFVYLFVCLFVVCCGGHNATISYVYFSDILSQEDLHIYTVLLYIDFIR